MEYKCTSIIHNFAFTFGHALHIQQDDLLILQLIHLTN
jgi:hypothetical protein